jgi:cytochrome b involved in lipid metabolism
MWKDEVQKLNDKKGFCMVIYDGKVFNVFRFMGLHTGGVDVIRNAGGTNVTRPV